ncbi:hypothetical protein M3P36_02790 [Altererythrobacter sp. KTW20L]|uniref:hypothetical protein n=1 Tax=Altererythrobacter sp. KTW20L TaxID=2942210 RepID=UPI0020BD5F90|nr:hypothetical protein [Altererythrobacter sp. KTW20L]MCL6249978.1 hypothetical protein [Altererythrobacter sp. KTW20L]
MAVGIVFLLGIASFALHSAVLASGHVVVRAFTGSGAVSSRLTLVLEFAVLVVAMAAAQADSAWGWAYAIYTACNAAAGWAILTGRM